MTETEINARFAMLEKQRNAALAEVVILYGAHAVLTEENAKLKAEIEKLNDQQPTV